MKRKQFLVINLMKALFTLMMTAPFFLSSAFADISNQFVLCKSDKSVRTLRVEVANNKCVAIYTKQGVDEVVGTSQAAQSCVEIISNIRKNLEGVKWACREVKGAEVPTFISSED